MSSTLENRLERALRCPVAWPDIEYLDEMPPFYNRLNFEWCADVCKVAVSDREVTIAESWIIDRECDLDDEDLRDAVINLEFTRERAIERHLNGVGRLAGLRFLTPFDQGKHLRPTLSQSAVNTATKSGPSLFYQNVSSERLCSAFWLWFEQVFWVGEQRMNSRVSPTCPIEETMFFPESVDLWHKFMTQHQLRIAFDAGAKVGANEGRETPFIAFDISVEAKTAHAYPISHAEAYDISEGRLFLQRI